MLKKKVKKLGHAKSRMEKVLIYVEDQSNTFQATTMLVSITTSAALSYVAHFIIVLADTMLSIAVFSNAMLLPKSFAPFHVLNMLLDNEFTEFNG